MKSFLDIAIPTLTFLTMLIVGLDLQASDLRALRRRKRLVAAGILVPFAVHPASALLLVKWLQLSPDATSGVLLIAACPAGAMSNFYTLLARGNVALSVVTTALSCLVGLISIPAILQVVGSTDVRPPLVPLLGQLLVLLVAPVGIGFLIRRRSGDTPIAATRTLRHLGTGAVATMVVIVFVAYISQSSAVLPKIALVSAIATASWFLCGYFVSWLLKADLRDRLTVGFGFAARNIGIAAAIAVTQLGRIDFAFVAACFMLVQMPLMLGGSWLLARSTQLGGREETD